MVLQNYDFNIFKYILSKEIINYVIYFSFHLLKANLIKNK